MSQKHRKTCVILSLMTTLNTDLSDQERLNSFLSSAHGILINHLMKASTARTEQDWGLTYSCDLF